MHNTSPDEPYGPSDPAAFRARGVRRRGRPSADRAVFEAPSTPDVLFRDRFSRRSLAVADALAAALALFVGVSVIGDDALRPAAALFVPMVVLVSKAIGLYDRDELLLRKTTLDDLPALLQLTTAYALLTWLLAPALVDGRLSRDQVLGLWGLLLCASFVGRGVARALARYAGPTERCLLVGDAETSARVEHQISDRRVVNAEVVDAVRLDANCDLARSLRRIAGLLNAGDIHRVILAPRTVDGDGVLEVIQLVKGYGVKVSLLPRVFEVVGSSIEFDDLGGMPVLALRRFGLSRSSWLLKRTLDVIAAGLLLLITAPVGMVIAIAIRLESSGPTLFRQTRVGRDGTRFEMFKFRTMVDGADEMKADLRHRNEAEGLFKIAEDPRVTRIGRLLRRTSLDELPQLINVLRGEMSLVGPRPLVEEEDDKIEGWNRRRLHLTPGMTGPWQILGSARIPLHEMVKIDCLYVANWSLWGDMKILARTIPYLLMRGGM